MSTLLRVGLDLDGSLESFGNSMTDLADALVETNECELVRFRTQSRPRSGLEASLPLRALWAPWWRRSLGPALDRFLAPVDVIHVAGRATPPTRTTPLVISVDDLRPLREQSREFPRIAQLRRAVAHGAILVASTRSAGHEVRRVLEVEANRVVVVPPAVPLVEPTVDGSNLLVNLTGVVTPFLDLAPVLVDFARRHGARVVALASDAAAQRIRAANAEVEVLRRSRAREALAVAKVAWHVSDGARFPSFAIAALAAGVPTIARATTINRELLSGAALLTEGDEEVLPALEDLWENPARRAIAVAAGRARAQDFAPSTAARAYGALYRDVVRGWGS